MTVTYTPMVQQYLEIKKEHPNELLFFRLGDFYEMFFEDALTASKELNITLTGRSAGTEDRIPMCGVPYHAVEGYIAKLVKKGFRIAICEQVSDPKDAKGIVERKVIKIITPGTVLSEQVIDDAVNRYLAYLSEDDGVLALAVVDVSTGECQWLTANGSERQAVVLEQIYRLQPAEIVVEKGLEDWEKLENWIKEKLPNCATSFYKVPDNENNYLKEHFAEASLDPLVAGTVNGLLSYLHATLMSDLTHINRLSRIAKEAFMNLDATAIRNLELIKNMRDGSKKGTLFDVLDFTSTSMGVRRLRNWIECPLLDVAEISKRQEAIEELLNKVALRDSLQEILKEVFDLERIISRLEVGSANARDLVSLRASLAVLPRIKDLLSTSESGLLRQLASQINLHEDIYNILVKAIVDEPPFSVREGGMIATGFNAELDELHTIARDNKVWMQNFEQKIKDETGIKTLKVGFNKVFGYYIEVSKGQSNLVPDYFVRKQTLVNAERYIVEELKDFENKILSAKEKIEQLEFYLFNQIRDEIRRSIVSIQDTAQAISIVDTLVALALVAFKYNYCRPRLNSNNEIKITDGRHPVVERLLEREIFVPNDVNLNSTDERMIIITGPNMAGKSTYMRQVALLVLLTQMGSFIPAVEATVCPVDRIFTRVGASDDLATGQSTFMVEMNEVAQILRYATKDSLIILDEVGRGTSTFDGMSIARAVMEYIQTKIKAKTLFATHYHQLMEIEELYDGVKNYSVAIKERGNDIVFLRRIVRGGTDRSYGVHVARLAGLPKKVIDRADEILQEYDSNEIKTIAVPKRAAEEPDLMNSLFTSAITEQLLKLDVMSLTPIEAMNELYKLQAEAKKESGV